MFGVFGFASGEDAEFEVVFRHAENAAGERAGDDAVEEAFVIYTATGQTLWALVDGAGQSAIRLTVEGSGEVENLLSCGCYG